MHVFFAILSFLEFQHFHVLEVCEFEDNSAVILWYTNLEPPFLNGNQNALSEYWFIFQVNTKEELNKQKITFSQSEETFLALTLFLLHLTTNA